MTPTPFGEYGALGVKFHAPLETFLFVHKIVHVTTDKNPQRKGGNRVGLTDFGRSILGYAHIVGGDALHAIIFVIQYLQYMQCCYTYIDQYGCEPI